jgi:glycosyltransferase involved in cell wall biosynthesis
MKILLLAPHPFYQDRGTPIAEHLLLKTLSANGVEIDVLAYHEGEDRDYPGVHIFRIPSMPFIHHVRPGLSLKKLVCDIPFLAKAWRMARNGDYYRIHATEEAVFIALLLHLLFRMEYVYDMDSLLSLQVAESLPLLGFLVPVMRCFERQAVRHASVVMPVCDNLAKLAHEFGAAKVVVTRDVSLLHSIPQDVRPLVELPSFAGVTFMYVGNLQKYQGIGLLLNAFAQAATRISGIRLVIVGGVPKDVARYRSQAETLGVLDRVVFLGPLPVSRLKAVCEAADVLVSPRVLGNNTPMKIYTYLDSGKAVLATDLPTHTEVLHPGIAMLAAPTPSAFGEAIVRLAGDANLRCELGRNALLAMQTDYAPALYEKAITAVYSSLGTRQITESPCNGSVTGVSEKRA